ncbi:MAG: DUF1232 domain-containing protein [Dehalococcoidia bacterium]|nr:DUF1232 domain-containing protein [Dehalococcoidia bacterium]
MPWYGWITTVLVLLALVAAGSYFGLRLSERGRRFLALPTSGRIRFGRALLRDRVIGRGPRLVLIALVAYLVSPLDLVPDFIPVLGQADDIAVVIATVALLILLIPRDRFEAALLEAEQPRPGSSPTPE